MSKTEGKLDGAMPLAGEGARADGENPPAPRRRRSFRILAGSFLGSLALLAAVWVFFPERALTGILSRKWHGAFPAISLTVSKLRPAATGFRGEGVDFRWTGPPERGLFRAASVTVGISGFKPSSLLPRISVSGESGSGKFDATVDPGSAATTVRWRFSGCRFGLPHSVMGSDALEIENGDLHMTVSGKRLTISTLRARLTAGTVEIQGIVRLGEPGPENGHLHLRGTLALDAVTENHGRPPRSKGRPIPFTLTGSLARPVLRILSTPRPAPNTAIADPPSPPVSSASARPDDNGRIENAANRFRLVGTVTGNSETSMAIIEDRSSRSQGLFRLGDGIGGGVLNAILRDRVVIVFGDSKIVLMTERGNGGNADDASGEIPLAVSEVDRALAALGRTFSQVRIRARTGAGPDRGVEIVDVAPGSIYDRMGIRSGDIVQAVNGTPIENPALFTRLHGQIRSLPLEISLETMDEAAPALLTAIDPGTEAVSREVANLAGRIRSGDPIALTIRRDGTAATLSYRVTP